MITLSALQGTLEENLAPIISVLENNSLQMSPVAMTKLGVAEKNRVEIGMDIVDGVRTFYIAQLDDDSKEGRSLSKTGKFQHTTMASALDGHKWEITEEIVVDNDLSWHKLIIFEAPQKEVVEEVVEQEPMPQAVDVLESVVEETEIDSVQEQQDSIVHPAMSEQDQY